MCSHIPKIGRNAPVTFKLRYSDHECRRSILILSRWNCFFPVLRTLTWRSTPGPIAKRGLLLSRGREDFSDFDSSVLRLKYTHVANCKPQAPPGRRWDFALELGYGRFLQIKLGPGLVLSSRVRPKSNFLKKEKKNHTRV